jgi:hypothetical protein
LGWFGRINRSKDSSRIGSPGSHLLKDVDKRLDSYFILRALLAPLVFVLSVPVAVAAPGVAPYIWLLVFLGQPVLRRVVYR